MPPPMHQKLQIFLICTHLRTPKPEFTRKTIDNLNFLEAFHE